MQILTGQQAGPDGVLATFDAAVDPASPGASDPAAWQVARWRPFEAADNGGQGYVDPEASWEAVTVLALAIDGATARLTVSSDLLADTPYRVTAPDTLQSTEPVTIDADHRAAEFVTAPSSDEESPDTWTATADAAVLDLGEGYHELVPSDPDAPGTALAEAVWLSLFTDAPADTSAGDALPDETGDPAERGGWWADSFDEGGPAGSKLWLLARAPASAETAAKAREYASEALQWLVDDEIAARVDVQAEREGLHGLALVLTITAADGTPHRYRHLWDPWR